MYNNGENVKLEDGDGVLPIICIKKSWIATNVIEKLEENIKYTNGKVEETKKTNLNTSSLDTKTSNGTDRDKIKQYSNLGTEKITCKTLKVNKDNEINKVVNEMWICGRIPVSWIYLETNKRIISN